MQRWRGLKALVEDAVEHGSRAVERVQLEMAQRPFGILEKIPPIAAPAKVVHQIHDVTVQGVHGVVRLVNHAAGGALDAVIDLIEEQASDEPTRNLPEPVPPKHEHVEEPAPPREAGNDPDKT